LQILKLGRDHLELEAILSNMFLDGDMLPNLSSGLDMDYAAQTP
jgi:hypothetical protein